MHKLGQGRKLFIKRQSLGIGPNMETTGQKEKSLGLKGLKRDK